MALEILGDSLRSICYKVILQAWILPWQLCNPLVEPAVFIFISSPVIFCEDNSPKVIIKVNKKFLNIQFKMADGRIRVSVLEGVGIPLPVCIHLQDFGTAVWRCSVDS